MGPLEEQLHSALMSSEPAQALEALAHQWRDTGVPQARIYAVFEACLAQQRNSADERLYDVIANTMDLLVGWCAPNVAIFPSRES